MKEVGASEAKTHLAELLDSVSRGESVKILRQGSHDPCNDRHKDTRQGSHRAVKAPPKRCDLGRDCS